MEALLAEQPLIVSLMLGTFAVGLIFGWLQTGKKAAAVAGLIAASLIPVAWVVASRGKVASSARRLRFRDNVL